MMSASHYSKIVGQSIADLQNEAEGQLETGEGSGSSGANVDDGISANTDLA